MADERDGHKWWQTLSGILTGSAGFLTAIAGLVVAVNQLGIFESKEPQQIETQAAAVPATAAGVATAAPSDVAVRGHDLVISQSLSWGPDKGMSAGVCLDGCANFVGWQQFALELEQKVFPLTRLAASVRPRLAPLAGKPDRVIEVIDRDGSVVANVWIGVNPAKSWRFDGLVRIGTPAAPPQIWSTLERLSDGTYRMH
jgi:hypothetical protein